MNIVEIKEPGTNKIYRIQVDAQASPAEIEADFEMARIREEKPTDVTKGMSEWEKLAAGAGRGATNVARQVGNIFNLVSDEEIEQAAELDRPLLETTSGQVGNILGELATAAPIGGGIASGLARGASTIAPKVAAWSGRGPLGGILRGATEGATEGAILAGPENRLEGAQADALFGGAGGFMLDAATKGFARVDPEAQKLLDLGVSNLTLGQLNPQGGINAIERAMQSTPVVGPWVKRSRGAAEENFGRQMISQAGPPGGSEVPEGELKDMLRELHGQYNDAYNPIKEVPLNMDSADNVAYGFMDAVDAGDVVAGEAERKTIGRFLDNQYSKLTKIDRPLKSGDLVDVRSDIRKQRAKQKRRGNFEQAEILEKAESAVNTEMARVLPEELNTFNKAVDRQYGKYKIIEDALYRAGDVDAPTPYKWEQAVKKAESNKGAYARGGGRFREPVAAARKVFEASPETGARAVMLGMLGLGGGGIGQMYGLNADPSTSALTMMGLGGLALTRGGRQGALGALRSQQAANRFLQSNTIRGPLTGQYLRGILPVMTDEEE